MPTKTRTLKSRSTAELEHDGELEAFELGMTRGLPGDDPGELVERGEIGAGQPPRGAPAGHSRRSRRNVDHAVDRARGRRGIRQALGMPSDRQISDEVIDELLAGAATEEEIAGPGGLLAELTKRLVERAMEVELTDHLGYEPHQEPPGGTGNQRNGTSPKTLITEQGKVPIDAPRDRDGSFKPRIVRKRQRRFRGFDEKILALYSRGLSVRDIEAHLEEIYGVKVGRDLISRVTDAVIDDVRDWAKRPLEDIYPIVFLDCNGAQDPRRRQRAAPRAVPRARRHARRRPRRARHVVSRDRGREVLDAGAQRSEDPWRPGHPDRVRRRPDRVSRRDRGDLPQDDHPNMRGSPAQGEPEVCAAARARAGRPRPEADLHRRRRRPAEPVKPDETVSSGN